MIQVFPILALRDNYIWCLHQEGRCVIVDPGEASGVLDTMQKNALDLCAILITHHHHDHTGGIQRLLEVKEVPVIGPARIAGVSSPLSQELVHVAAMDITFKVIAVPGHTLDHVAYYQQGRVFTGDTLFTAGCGKLFEGTPLQMHASLARLQALPHQTLIYCGHEYTESNLEFALTVEPTNTNILQRLHDTQALRKRNLPTVPAPLWLEKQTNPFLRCHQRAVVEAASAYCAIPLSDPVQVLHVLREWKNCFHS